jgi:hypothetical protein
LTHQQRTTQSIKAFFAAQQILSLGQISIIYLVVLFILAATKMIFSPNTVKLNYRTELEMEHSAFWSEPVENEHTISYGAQLIAPLKKIEHGDLDLGAVDIRLEFAKLSDGSFMGVTLFIKDGGKIRTLVMEVPQAIRILKEW